MGAEDDEVVYMVVVNHEQQYSIWPADDNPPAGWVATGPRGTRAECLEHVARTWTDMRPRSLRRP
ncbi:MAG TPA: MbtH family protein [Acidimicrobiales bacterium]|nr:MbtH family protein [Acidimicrobiales bacterium]